MTNVGGAALGLILAGIGFAASGCGGSLEKAQPSEAGGPASAGAPGLDGGAGGGAGAGLPGAGSPGSAGSDDCTSEVPGPSLLASTPREDTNAELLALKFSGQVVADQAVYDRIVSDLSAIRQLDPSVASILYFSPNDGKSLLLGLDVATSQSIEAGSYHAWDCLNAAYGATDVSLSNVGPSSFAEVALKGIYRIDAVAKQYAKLEGITSASPGSGGGDGPTICLTRASDAWHYVFDDASGDCPSGCTEHVYKHFTTDESGAVENLGEPSSNDILKYVTKDACE